MKTRLLLWSLFPIFLSLLYPVYGEELKILESQLNENSISGIVLNQHNVTIGNIEIRAEFYDRDDNRLVGVRDWGRASIDPLEPNQESSYKISESAGRGDKEFPNTFFIVRAEGDDYNREGGMFGGLIQNLEQLEQGLKNVTKAAREAKNSTIDLNLNLTGKDN